MDRWLQRVHGRQQRTLISVFILLAYLLVPVLAIAMPAYPGPVFEQQPDGSTVELRIRGDEYFNWLEDANGYTVVRNGGWLQYARLDASGKLSPSGLNVGQADPRASGLARGILPSAAVRAQSALNQPLSAADNGPAAVPPFGTVRNLVILVRFADHTVRTQPTEANYDVLMNSATPDATYAPTGSLKAVYLENSYGQLTLQSTIAVWVTVSGTEAFYAAGNSGLSTALHPALREALDAADAYINFDDFDADNDNNIDSITFLHSGYAAEFGGIDQYGANSNDRIWSHKWNLLASGPAWTSSTGVRVTDYHISPGVWGITGNDIGRIGVISHETGHFFGLPDLYDTDGSGEGIGSWGLMANSWDFNWTQYCPPHFSPWSKINLGWYTPTVITGPGQFTLNEAEYNAEVYRVDSGFPSLEYLLIENRQNTGFDCTIPQGGLLVWHIDDATGDNIEGYPGQGNWPGNGKHYRVAVLGADGNYDLEKGNNRGDAGDTHHALGVDAMGSGPGGHPNTDAYQNGNIIQTGNIISDISASGPAMTFCLNGCSSLNAPSGLTATATGTTTIDLAWTDNSPDEDGFTIERSPDGIAWSSLATTVVDTVVYTDSGLNPGTAYFYRARAFNATLTSSWSNTANATTNPIPPAAPSALSATAVGENQIDLAWTDNAGNEDGFRIERSFNGIDFSIIASVASNVTGYSNTGLSPSTIYYYRVYAFNSAGNSAFASANATTDAPPPFVDYVAYADQFGAGQVSGTYVDTQTGNGVSQSITEKSSGGKKRNRTSFMGHFWRFNIGPGDIITVNANAWQSASGDGDNFVFAWSDDDSTYTDLFTVSSLLGSNDETGTIPNSVSGEVWIRVIDTDRTPGNARSFDTLFVDHLYIRVENTGPPTVPNDPGGLAAVSGGSDNIDLSWSDNAPDEQGFYVERSPDGLGAWAQVASLPANTTSHNDAGLTDDTTYYYRVRAWNAVGNSGYSNVASATTDVFVPITPPAAPSGLSALTAGSSSIDLAWTDNADNETGFHIQRSLDGITGWSIVASIGANALSWSDSGLDGNTTYYYQVRSINSLYQSDWSNIANATTDVAANITLSTSGYKSKGRKNFDLSWSPSDGGTVNVFRDGSLVTTTADDGSYSYNSGLKGGGSHTHQVCETDTGTCSNITTTVF